VRKLKYLGDVVDIDVLWFYGCSFTAGEELFWQEYHDLIKNERSPKRRVMLEKKRERQEKNHAWPSHLSAKLGVECKNRAKPGNSMDKMRSELVRDFVNGEIRPNSGVVFGTTGFMRETHFFNFDGDLRPTGEASHLGGKAWTSVLDIHHDRLWENLSETHRDQKAVEMMRLYYNRIKNPYYHLYNYMNCFHDVMLFCQQHDLPLYVVQSMENLNIKHLSHMVYKLSDVGKFSYKTVFENQEFYENLTYIREELDKYIIMKGSSLADLNKPYQQMPRGHPCLETHIEFGTKLAEYF
tara:strand:- start:3076 stop:3963 length:888 start_codon:yes stop_codon:yes gene_type:complete